MKLKFCGFKTIEDVYKAKDLDIDAIGFIHYPKSKRYVDIDKIEAFANIIPEDKDKVVIVVNPDYQTLSNLIDNTNITTIQLHGSENLETIHFIRQKKDNIKIIKALPAKNANTLAKYIQYYKGFVDRFIIDTPSISYGGTGQSYDWEILKDIADVDFLIAGGMDYKNIQSVSKLSLNHNGYDIASGIETNGVKDSEKMQAIIELVKGVN
ncbi:phosphoribosylanthranilate isomerase [Staphylococcus cohnii]|uniref:N-(5'-phosphoribosyl)anthranilate isomerase n=1 Tax=Staphylococcus cohnii subsp. cohnii TaxID=74704 RepID=A0A0M2NXX7_STACC|nr:phosphoribosylanthranilate isomerase [Staphylococcus cohnii]TGP60499.1 phosphoribosylanthranilate isomerase [bacterium M00.F.Ca.ET.229.01.1.1]TGS37257.1 phosphoribosylanthranilate isomerase [bacterium M00.F.Ca.ET.180.01.1.1]AYX89780.1 phosphoribosylanthranilate isomerase [Staphylococcus cohnii]KKI62805.1 Phosphoribosylanthranilate isomerase [Staphylococcus cohnii subsp. cohnii]MCI2941977.1 phosphoribosylanthranilate isomerase [Staphylococcus cohnii]